MSDHGRTADQSAAGGDDRGETPESRQLIRGALMRKALADARQRGALARRLHLTDSEVIAIQHLALAGELTPGQLANLLQLSSGGTTALIQRLLRAGHVTRHPHPYDRRSAVVRLTPETAGWAAAAWQPYTAQLDALADDLAEPVLETIRRYLQGAAEAAERHADRLARDAATAAQDELAVPLPALWA